jgi:hypothetical protein
MQYLSAPRHAMLHAPCRSGRVTSLYLPEKAALAEAIRAAVARGERLEGCFSRNRSFSQKLKRYGQYVPRGQTLQDVQAGREE